jgi:hypothetical protein
MQIIYRNEQQNYTTINACNCRISIELCGKSTYNFIISVIYIYTRVYLNIPFYYLFMDLYVHIWLITHLNLLINRICGCQYTDETYKEKCV